MVIQDSRRAKPKEVLPEGAALVVLSCFDFKIVYFSAA